MIEDRGLMIEGRVGTREKGDGSGNWGERRGISGQDEQDLQDEKSGGRGGEGGRAIGGRIEQVAGDACLSGTKRLL